MNDPFQEKQIEDIAAIRVDPYEYGWTKTEHFWHPKKATIVAFVMLVIWLVLFAMCVVAAYKGVRSNMSLVAGLSASLVAIAVIYFKLVHKHVPLFAKLKDRGQFIGVRALEHIQNTLRHSHLNEEQYAMLMQNEEYMKLPEIERLRLELAKLRRDYKELAESLQCPLPN